MGKVTALRAKRALRAEIIRVEGRTLRDVLSPSRVIPSHHLQALDEAVHGRGARAVEWSYVCECNEPLPLSRLNMRMA